MNTRNPNRRWAPSPEYRFFLFDSEGEGMVFYRSVEERDAAAEKAIATYCDQDGWSDEVERVCVGEVTSLVQKTNIEEKPKREDYENDEDFEDAMAEWPDETYDETCTYELLPLNPADAAIDAARGEA